MDRLLPTMALWLAILLVAPTAMAQTDAGESDTGSIGAMSVNQKTFRLVAQPEFLACLRASDETKPKAIVTVIRGHLHDTLTLTIKNIKPNLGFDLFTIENTNLLANGTVDPSFKGNFGLAWYQTDVQADAFGNGQVTIRTILVDQIFGFDSGALLTPTHTFHVGFWFNNPEDAAPCGFDTKPTPFNGEQNAGPNAMISVPDATTDLGPLCLNPNTSTVPATCNP